MNWEATSAVAGAVSALAGLLAVYFALRTIRSAREAALEQNAHAERLVASQTAHETYNDYLRLCIQYPELSSYEVAVKQFKFPSADYVRTRCTRETEQYLWLVSYLLNACERILVDSRQGEDWHDVIFDQLDYHEPIIAEMRDDWASHYDTRLCRIICEVTKCPGCEICDPESQYQMIRDRPPDEGE